LALSDATKDYIQAALGYPLHPDTTATFSDAFDRVDASAATTARLLAIINELVIIQGQVTTARAVAGSAYDQLLAEAQRLNYQLSNSLGVEVRQKLSGPAFPALSEDPMS
jgi:alkyl hydroperoxide reductase subunit AhpC